VRLALCSLAFLLAACPSKETDTSEQAIAKMRALTDRMCECTTRPCAKSIMDELSEWSTLQSKRSSEAPTRPDTMKTMHALGQTFSECLEQLGHPWVSADELLTNMLREKRDGQTLAAAMFPAVNHRIQIDEHDPSHNAVFELGRIANEPSTDPCVRLEKNRYRWNESQIACVEVAPVAVRCSVLQIWRRARQKNVPADRIAKIELAIRDAATWKFTFHDDARGVSSHSFADDCPSVEK
jgi:hypothetical protein